MKKTLLFVSIIFLTYFSAGAQEIGIRVGDIASGNNAAIDAVFATAKLSRIHADVSFGSGVGIDLLWDFIHKPLKSEAFSWYAGVGPYMRIDDPFWFGISGELGLEYGFNSVPIVLGIDWRPSFSIIEETEMHWSGFGFNARWAFGK